MESKTNEEENSEDKKPTETEAKGMNGDIKPLDENENLPPNENKVDIVSSPDDKTTTLENKEDDEVNMKELEKKLLIEEKKRQKKGW